MEQIILTDFFVTKNGSNDFLVRLGNISSVIFETNFDLDSVLTRQFDPAKKDAFMRLLSENNVSVSSPTELTNFVERIKKEIANMPSVDLTIAVPTDTTLLKNIANWFFLNLGKQVLLNVNTDENIIAGAIINYQGKLFDSTLKSTFLSKSAQILEKPALQTNKT